MAKKRKTLPKEMRALLEAGDIAALKEQFLRCEANAVTSKFGSNIFSLSPLPREFAFWAREQGADVNFKDYYGKTPIFMQASHWQGDVPLLIDLGADVQVADGSGTTPLHLAALYGRTAAVKALLNAGVDANVRSGRMSWPGELTPLEETLAQDRLSYPALLEICGILFEHGAEITDRARGSLLRSAENFQRVKRGIADAGFLRSQTEGLEQLYRIFEVEPVGETPFHDGRSPICIPDGETDAFRWLWDFLVPLRGKAPTAQGEAVRIAGRVRDEIVRNGGMNWDGEYRKMLRSFPKYLRLGEPLEEAEIAQAEAAVRLLRDGWDPGKLCDSLCGYAAAWAAQNPDVLPPLEADYTR